MKTETYNALTSLICINHDRSTGYEHEAETVSDPDLKNLFRYLSKQSQEFTKELAEIVKKDDPAYSTSVKSDLTYAWSTETAQVPGNQNRSQLLSSCEFREDAAKRTYDDVMEHTEYISEEVYEIMCKHRSEIHRTHNTVKALYFNF